MIKTLRGRKKWQDWIYIIVLLRMLKWKYLVFFNTRLSLVIQLWKLSTGIFMTHKFEISLIPQISKKDVKKRGSALKIKFDIAKVELRHLQSKFL